MQSRNRDAETGLADTVGKERVGPTEKVVLKRTYYHVEQTANRKLLYGTGKLNTVLCDNQVGWGRVARRSRGSGLSILMAGPFYGRS